MTPKEEEKLKKQVAAAEEFKKRAEEAEAKLAEAEASNTDKKPIEIKLPEEVGKKYKLVGWIGGNKKNFGRLGDIDINSISLLKADQLFASKSPYLELKNPPSTANN